MPEKPQTQKEFPDITDLFLQEHFKATGFSPVVMKMWGIELKPEDYSVVNRLQNIQKNLESWKKTPALIKLFNHAIGTLTFGLVSDNAPPPEEAEKYGGWIYKQADIPVLNSLYKNLISDYGLSAAGLTEGFSLLAGGEILGKLAGRPLLGIARRIGLLEKLGLDKLVGAEIIKPLIPDGAYKILAESSAGKFAWDSFKLGLGMIPFGGYFRMREARWSGEDPNVRDWLEGTLNAKNIGYSLVSAPFLLGAHRLVQRGLRGGVNRYVAWRLEDKGVEDIVRNWNVAIPEAPISKDLGRFIYRKTTERLQEINKDIHTTPIGERLTDFDPENVHRTLNNLEFLKQLIEPYVKLTPEQLGRLGKVSDILKEHAQAFQLLKRYGVEELMPLFRKLDEFANISGDDLGLSYLLKNSEELNIIRELAPETVDSLKTSVGKFEKLLRENLFGSGKNSFLLEASERIFGRRGQQMPAWSYNALKDVFRAYGIDLGTLKNTKNFTLDDRLNFAYLLFRNPELVDVLRTRYFSTINPLWERYVSILEQIKRTHDEEILPLWQQLPDELKDIFINKEKSNVFQGERAEEIRPVFDDKGNLIRVEPIERKTTYDIEKETGRLISDRLDYSDTEQTKKIIEEVLPVYGEAASSLKETPEKFQEFLFNFSKILNSVGKERLMNWINEQPALDNLLELSEKVDKISRDPFAYEFFSFVSKNSFVNERFQKELERKISSANKLGLLKGVFALGIREDERILSYLYRIFHDVNAQQGFVGRYVQNYIQGTLDEFFKKEYQEAYKMLQKMIAGLPKDYSPDNLVDALRIIANDPDVLRMKAEIETSNLGIDPFVSPKEFFRRLSEIHRHDLARTTEAFNEAVREVAQEEVKPEVSQSGEQKVPIVVLKETEKKLKEPPIKNIPKDLKDIAKEFIPYRFGDTIDEILDGYKLNPGDRAKDIIAILGKGRYMKVATKSPYTETFSEVAERLGYTQLYDFIWDIDKRMDHRKNWTKEIKRYVENLESSSIEPKQEEISMSLNFPVSPAFTVLGQFYKDAGDIQNRIASYIENLQLVEKPENINLTEFSLLFPKVEKKITELPSVGVIFNGKMFNIDTTTTFEEKGRKMAQLVGLTRERETIPITKEFANLIKYLMSPLEEILGKRPSIEDIIKSLIEPFEKPFETGISEIEIPY